MNEPASEVPAPVIMVTGHSSEPTMAERETVRQMEPKISQFVGEHLKDKVFLNRFRLSRAKIVPKRTIMTPVFAEQIMKDMGIECKSDEAYLQAYYIMSITENFGAIWEERPPSDAEQKLAIQQRVDTLAVSSYDSKLTTDKQIEMLNEVLAVLK